MEGRQQFPAKLKRRAIEYLLLFAGALTPWGTLQCQASQDPPPVPYVSSSAKLGVFVDHETGDAVILYPNRSDNPPTRVPLELSRHVDPAIRTRMRYKADENTYEFEYSLENGQHARQNAQLWYFEDLTDPTATSVSVPSGWEYHFPSHSVEPSSTNIASHTLSVIVDSISQSSQKGIAPGERRAGLSMTSTLLPGLLAVYVQGRSSILALPEEPDSSLADQIVKVTGFPYNYRITFAIGPRYSSSISQAQLASLYLRDVRKLYESREGTVSKEFYDVISICLTKSKDGRLSAGDLASLKSMARVPYELELASVFPFVFKSDHQ